MSEKTKEVIAKQWDYDAPRSLVDFIAALQTVLESIPKEYRSTAKVDYTPTREYGEKYNHFEVSFERPITVDELAEESLRTRREVLELRRLAARYSADADRLESTI